MLVLLYCSLYLFMMAITTTITKVNEKIYDYAPLNITIFYINVFYPLLILIYLKLYSWKDLLKLSLADIKFILIPSVLYTIEFVILYWCLLYVPLGFYMIARTSSAFINVLFAKYYLYKTVHTYYYVGLVNLLIAYILFLIGLGIKSDTNYEYILSIILTFISGVSTSVYNNMGEKYFMNKTNDNVNKINYLVIYNLPGFLILFPIFVGLATRDNNFIADIGPNMLYTIAGICVQLYIFIKLYILATKNISGNQLVTGTELLRRVLTNIVAYLWLNEKYNTCIILANIFMLVGSILIIFGSLKSKSLLKTNDIQNKSQESILLDYIAIHMMEEFSDDNNSDSDTDTDKIIIVEDINDIGLTEDSLLYKEN